MVTWRPTCYQKPKGHSIMKSKKNFKNTLKQMTMKTQPYKTYGMQQKQSLEGSSQWYRPSSKTKKKLK